MGNVTAVIIDDDELMRRAVRAALLALECDILGEASDGDEGLEMVRDKKPDLILLDIRMPRVDGTEVIQTMSDAGDNAYVVMLTHVSDGDAVEDCMIAGAKDFLRKDMPLKEMAERLERHVTRLSQRH